jgi:DNA-binding CsgD family transcriptional regulator
VTLSAFERSVLLAAANGLTASETSRLYLWPLESVRSCRVRIMRKLGARTFSHAFALAWRACLVEADEVAGGPVPGAPPFDSASCLLTYRERMRLLPPPPETFAQLRQRCRRLASAA